MLSRMYGETKVTRRQQRLFKKNKFNFDGFNNIKLWFCVTPNIKNTKDLVNLEKPKEDGNSQEIKIAVAPTSEILVVSKDNIETQVPDLGNISSQSGHSIKFSFIIQAQKPKNEILPLISFVDPQNWEVGSDEIGNPIIKEQFFFITRYQEKFNADGTFAFAEVEVTELTTLTAKNIEGNFNEIQFVPISRITNVRYIEIEFDNFVLLNNINVEGIISEGGDTSVPINNWVFLPHNFLLDPDSDDGDDGGVDFWERIHDVFPITSSASSIKFAFPWVGQYKYKKDMKERVDGDIFPVAPLNPIPAANYSSNLIVGSLAHKPSILSYSLGVPSTSAKDPTASSIGISLFNGQHERYVSTRPNPDWKNDLESFFLQDEVYLDLSFAGVTNFWHQPLLNTNENRGDGSGYYRLVGQFASFDDDDPYFISKTLMIRDGSFEWNDINWNQKLNGEAVTSLNKPQAVNDNSSSGKFLSKPQYLNEALFKKFNFLIPLRIVEFAEKESIFETYAKWRQNFSVTWGPIISPFRTAYADPEVSKGTKNILNENVLMGLNKSFVNEYGKPKITIDLKQDYDITKILIDCFVGENITIKYRDNSGNYIYVSGDEGEIEATTIVSSITNYSRQLSRNSIIFN